MLVLKEKFLSNLYAVAPITIIVIILNLTIVPIGIELITKFIIGSILIIVGLTLFLIGIDTAVTPLGTMTGVSLAKTNKLYIVIIAGLILGFFISASEPGLMVLATQVETITSGGIDKAILLIVVSIGLSILLSFGFIRIFYNIPLYIILFVLYGIVFILAIFSSSEFLGIAFDASGSTTGILAVPFILSLSVGISALKKDSKSSEKDSFGLIAVASVGAIISVLILNIVSNNEGFNSEFSPLNKESSGLFIFIKVIPEFFKESLIALFPLVLIFVIMQYLFFKLKKYQVLRIGIGFLYAFVGLLIFLVGVNAGFMEVGMEIGMELVAKDNLSFVVIIGFLLGFLTILAEPAVYILTEQIEDVTSGYVNKKMVLAPLAIGVGLAVALSVLRIISPNIMLWHYLLPGYIIALVLSFFAPKLFVGIAFDAGGVATGPMTATFILAFTQGVARGFEGADLLKDGFGMIAMVAMTPIITLQILGVFYKIKSERNIKKENTKKEKIKKTVK